MISDETKQAGRRIIFDISGLEEYLSRHENFSGIQRVVASLIPAYFHSLDCEEKDLTFYATFDKRQKDYKCGRLCDIVDSMRDPNRLRHALGVTFQRSFNRRSQIPILKKYSRSSFKFYFHRLKLDLAYVLRNEQRFLRHNITRSDWAQMRKSASVSRTARFSKISAKRCIRSDDVVVMLDASWSASSANTFRKLSRRGVKIVTLIHDMIPISAPGFFGKSHAQRFAVWLSGSVEYTNTFIATSASVRTEVESYLRSVGSPQYVRALPLVQNFPHATIPKDVQTPLCKFFRPQDYPQFNECYDLNDQLRALTQQPFVLCAGTIECRKNPLRLAHAWLSLLRRSCGDLPKLVFAGRKGWMIKDFEALLTATGNLYGYTEIVEHPSDVELAFLYRNCQFVVMPSLYEGWGLPVGEAFSFGKTALISDVSSLPEVGQDLVEYCDPRSVQSIADGAWKLLETSARLQELEAKIASTQLRTWNDVARDLKRILN